MFMLNESTVPIVFKYRIESNFGSKYFDDEKAAVAYFDYLMARKLDAELWLVCLHYDADGDLEKGVQKLLMAQDADGIVDFT